MAKKDSVPEPLKAWEDKISPLDIFVLNKLCQGHAQTTLHQVVNSELNADYSRTDITKIIEKLKNKGLIISPSTDNENIFTIIPNPTKLFNHIMITYLKLPLRPMLRRDRLTWDVAIEEIRDINNRKYKLNLFMIFTPEGEGEYDIGMFISTNKLDEYYSFIEDLTAEELVEKSKTQRIHLPAGFFFNPVMVPSYEEFKNASDHYRKTLNEFK